MRRCLELAMLGADEAAPNPMVGAVIVQNERIVGEGYHQKCGEAHAEINAFQSVKDKSIFAKCSLYVSLEPCSHEGRTGSCAKKIIELGIPKVVIGCLDPFAEVNGRGIEMLKNSGVEVRYGILENECIRLNKRFFKFYGDKRPWVRLKWAKTSDGFFDKHRADKQIGTNWITTRRTKQLIHKWRSEEQAILVGSNTVINDDPKLNVREINGASPLRLIIDPKLKIPRSSQVYSDGMATIIFNNSIEKVEDHIIFYKVVSDDFIPEIFNFCRSENIISLLVEGGANLLSRFINRNCWDEAVVLTGDICFKQGLAAPKINAPIIDRFNFGTDSIKLYRND